MKYNKNKLLLLYDLYWLRYKNPKGGWYELTDYLRDKLVEDGFKISYDDKNKDLIFDGHSIKDYINGLR